MRTSESIGAIAAALAAAQSELSTVKKDKRADAGRYGYTYASLAAVVESVAPVLSKHGLSFVQGVSQDAKACTVITRIAHKSGEWFESDCTMPIAGGGAQAVGSAITYGRRYGLSAMLGVVTDDDDDGAEAERYAPRRGEKPKPQSLEQAVSQAKPEAKAEPSSADAVKQWADRMKACTTLADLKAAWEDIPRDKMSDEWYKKARELYGKRTGEIAGEAMG